MKGITIKDIVKATNGRLIAGDMDKPISHIALDSRTMEGDDIFVPIIGAKTDGHLYIDKAFENGAVATFTSEHETIEEPANDKAYIKVDDTVRALQALGAYLRARLDMPFVGVTGSVGKTTTREMVSTALSASLLVTATKGNSNSQVGVPLTLSLLDEKADVAVIELGISEPGEMPRISALARPNVAIMTNIGVSHIEFLGSQENIMREKLHITDGFDEGGVLIVNGDDALLRTLKGTLPFHVLTYGTSETCDIRAVDIKTDVTGSTFTVLLPDELPVINRRPDGSFVTLMRQTEYRDGLKVKLNIPGAHSILNALSAITASGVLGVCLGDAVEALSQFKNFNRRLEVKQADGFTIIDDSYNASPDSMKAALQVLDEMPCEGKKIAVLADMLELGPDSPAFHNEVGEYAKGLSIDEYFIIGELAKNITKGLGEGAKLQEFSSNSEATKALKNTISKGDLVLFKGSNGMKLGDIINEIRECHC